MGPVVPIDHLHGKHHQPYCSANCLCGGFWDALCLYPSFPRYEAMHYFFSLDHELDKNGKEEVPGTTRNEAVRRPD